MANRYRFSLGVLAVLLMLFVLAGSALAASGRTLSKSTPEFVTRAQNLGPEDATKVINITVRLQQHNIAEREALLTELYTPGSTLYHKWLTAEQYAAKFAPRASEAAAVRQFLEANGFSVTSMHHHNLYIEAQGRIADAQKAFNVQINRFKANGKTAFSNTTDISVQGPAAAYIQAVQGLHPVLMTPHHTFPVNPDTGQPFPSVPFTSVVTPHSGSITPSQFFENQCWRGVESHAFTTSGQLPIGVYTGNRYGGNINGGAGHYPPCGYEPAAIQVAYGIQPLIAQGNDGSGQTVVIVDAFGSPTAAADFAVFSSTFGLPTGNFNVYSPSGTPPYNSGWAGETTLDIEWAHAMAPGAKIALVQSIDNYDNNLQNAILWALEANNGSPLGNQISNSYGGDEYDADAPSMQGWDDVLAQAAALGVSVQFSTGDNGDFYRAVGASTVSVPSDSPHATAVGGTSDFLNADYSMKFQSGWGTDLTRVASPNGTNPPNVPPVCATTLAAVGKCYYFGGGGGASTFFAKPSWQSALPGSYRLQPDISMTADPYTGVEIIYSYSNPGNYSVSVIGGTSASCPMFSGLWALVNQRSQALHGRPAGQAAPYLYGLSGGAIRDVHQTSVYSATNVAGTIMRSGLAPLYESPAAIVGPDVSTGFTSAFYQGTSTRWYVISFGTDSSLVVNNGWDPVTGLGSPNGASFVNGVLNQIH